MKRAPKKKDFAEIPDADVTTYLRQHGVTAATLLAVMFVPKTNKVLVAKMNNNDDKHEQYEVTFDDGQTKGRSGAAVLAAIDIFGDKCIVTAGKGLEFCENAPKVIGDIKNAVLTADVDPNLILAAPKTDTKVYLVDGKTMKTLTLGDRTEINFARALKHRAVLATAQNKLYAGVYNGSTFTWTEIGAMEKNIVWLGRVNGDYVTIALDDGTQILLSGVESIGSDGKVALNIVHTINDDARSPVGKVAGNDNRFALLAQGPMSTQVHFTPPSGKGAPKIAAAMAVNA
jgi:hypothetical protein